MMEGWRLLASAVLALMICTPNRVTAATTESSNNEDILVNSLFNLEGKAGEIKSFIDEVSKDKDSDKSKRIPEYDKLILSVIYSLREDGSLFTDFALLLLDKLFTNKTHSDTFQKDFKFPESDIVNTLKYFNSTKYNDDVPQHVLDRLFQFLYEAPMDKYNQTLVDYGLEKNYAIGLKRLFGKRPINEKGDTLLHLAAQNDYMDSVKTLLDGGMAADVKNKEGQTPLYYALKNEHNKTATYLVSKGADIESRDKAGDTQLHIAARLGDIDGAVALIDAGARLDVENEGQTPLYRAAQYDRGNMMSVLLGNGANLYYTSNGKELIHKAAALNHTAAVENLLRFEVKVDTNKTDGQTPLHWAARGGHTALVELLLDRGANASAQSYDRKTPLHEAAYWANYDAARTLIAHGAKINALDISGRTPIDYASDNDQHAMRDLLRSYENQH